MDSTTTRHRQAAGQAVAAPVASCTWLLLSLLAVSLLTGVGCSRQRDFLNVNDQLRQENLALRQEVQQLQQQIDQRVAQIDAMQQQLAGESAIPLEDVQSPQFTRISIGRYTGIIDSTSDGRDDLLRVYLRTLDQKGRFLPATGQATIQAVAAMPGQSPVVLAEASFTPAAFDAAYRTGFTGTHYTLQIPLQAPIPKDAQQATVVVQFTEARTGITVTDQIIVPLH